MNKSIFLLFVALLATAHSTAATTLRETSRKARNSTFLQEKVDSVDVFAISEDFSKFTAGSEASPDPVNLTGENAGSIPDSLMQQSGWSGHGIFQAGGMAFLGNMYYNEMWQPGYLVTPMFNTSSVASFTVKFKARSKSPQGDSLAVYWNWNFHGRIRDTFQDVMLTDQWEDYELTISHSDTAVYLDFWTENHEMYIDDIQIVLRVPDTISDTIPDVDPPNTIKNLTDTKKPQFFVNNEYLFIEHLEIGRTVEIYNMLGQCVRRQPYFGNSISVGDIPNGVYIIRSGFYTQKIVKQ